MKIIAYDDNPDFGGHQIMACHGIEALAAAPAVELSVLHNPANRKLAQRLEQIPNCQTGHTPCSAQQLEPLNPDLVLCIQGDIAQSSRGIRIANRIGIECVSYLALPHRLATMGARLGAFRDLRSRHLLNQPSRYIAISESMANLLKQRGVKKPISIVPNGIPMRHAPRAMRREPQFVLGMLGRIEFNQKQQDFMVRAFRNHPQVFGDHRLLIAGNGPDEHRLAGMVSRDENIDILPWNDDPETFYEQIDFLVIPSRYEGVPLVMLEALARGIPVIGSRIDGMKEILPGSWTFEPENAAALARTFSRVRATWTDKIGPLQKRIQSGYPLETFKTNFVNAVCNGGIGSRQ